MGDAEQVAGNQILHSVVNTESFAFLNQATNIDGNGVEFMNCFDSYSSIFGRKGS